MQPCFKIKSEKNVVNANFIDVVIENVLNKINSPTHSNWKT